MTPPRRRRFIVSETDGFRIHRYEIVASFCTEDIKQGSRPGREWRFEQVRQRANDLADQLEQEYAA